MNILYCGYIREQRFIGGIHHYLDYDYRLIQEVKEPFSCLDNINALVFVGKQKNIFREHQEYYDFLYAARNKKIPVIAILEEDVTLPGSNRDIDKVIERSREKKTLEDIAYELRKFLG